MRHQLLYVIAFEVYPISQQCLNNFVADYFGVLESCTGYVLTMLQIMLQRLGKVRLYGYPAVGNGFNYPSAHRMPK